MAGVLNSADDQRAGGTLFLAPNSVGRNAHGFVALATRKSPLKIPAKVAMRSFHPSTRVSRRIRLAVAVRKQLVLLFKRDSPYH